MNHGLGRITGSASIETLVRVGIEKEHGLSPDSKMVVLHDFTPCVDDELEVKRGQIVNILYRENDWVYVIGQDTRQEGFIPYSYCAPYNTQLADLAIKKKLPRDLNANNSNTNNNNSTNINNSNNLNSTDLIDGTIDISTTDLIEDNSLGGLVDMQGSLLKQSQASLSSEPDFLPFAKDICGRYIVLYTFIARDENDVSVERGEFVTGICLSLVLIDESEILIVNYVFNFPFKVLNREDPEWFWIVRSDGQEGFIPSGFVYPADNVLQQNNSKPTNGGVTNETQQTKNENENITNSHAVAVHGAGNVILTANLANNGNANNSHNQATILNGSEDLRYHGTELVMLYDYKVTIYSSNYRSSCLR